MVDPEVFWENIRVAREARKLRRAEPKHPEDGMTGEDLARYNSELISNGTPYIRVDGREYDVNGHVFEQGHAGEPFISAHTKGPKSRRGDPTVAGELSKRYAADVVDMNVRRAAKRA